MTSISLVYNHLCVLILDILDCSKLCNSDSVFGSIPPTLIAAFKNETWWNVYKFIVFVSVVKHALVRQVHSADVRIWRGLFFVWGGGGRCDDSNRLWRAQRVNQLLHILFFYPSHSYHIVCTVVVKPVIKVRKADWLEIGYTANTY